MTDNPGNKKNVFLNVSASKTFAEASANALEKNQYEVVKNSTGNFRENCIYEVPLKDIDQDDKRCQMRESKQDISAIKKSIEEVGQRTAVVLNQKKGCAKYIIISGFTRTRAISELKLLTVRAIILNDISDIDALEYAMTENEARKDLTDWERIHGVVMLINGGRTAIQVAAIIGKDDSTISYFRKVYSSKSIITEALKKDVISYTQALALTLNQDKLNDAQLRDLVSRSEDLSVSQLKDAIRELLISVDTVVDPIQAQKRKPKTSVNSQRNNSGIYFRSSKTGDTLYCNAKFAVSKENKAEAIMKIEQLLKDIKEL